MPYERSLVRDAWVVPDWLGACWQCSDRYGRKTKKQRAPIKSRDWVSAKKERQARQGKSSRPDSKYTGRRRLRAPVV